MIKLLSSLVLILSLQVLFAQEIPDKNLIKDSLLLRPEPLMQNLKFSNEYLTSDDFLSSFKLTEFKFDDVLSMRWKMNFSGLTFNNIHSGGFSNEGFGFMPFFRNGRILSATDYKIGDKMILGGFSYGANSIFSVPSFNRENNRFDFYGTTLFLQYKVSKNFKIETRVNVTKSPGPVF